MSELSQPPQATDETDHQFDVPATEQRKEADYREFITADEAVEWLDKVAAIFGRQVSDHAVEFESIYGDFQRQYSSTFPDNVEVNEALTAVGLDAQEKKYSNRYYGMNRRGQKNTDKKLRDDERSISITLSDGSGGEYVYTSKHEYPTWDENNDRPPAESKLSQAEIRYAIGKQGNPMTAVARYAKGKEASKDSADEQELFVALASDMRSQIASRLAIENPDLYQRLEQLV